MYKYIINPITKEKININSTFGKTILKNYIMQLSGGKPNTSSQNIVCFLTVRPNKTFLDFCDSLHSHYNVFVCVDDNSYKVPKTQHCNIIQINNNTSKNAGFHNILGYYNKKFKNKSISRDKALYYFYHNLPKNKYVWFIEEDVFIPQINTLINIDNKYPQTDLLCKQNLIYNNIQDTIKPKWYHWQHVFNDSNLNFPYGRSMICAIRCSYNLIQLIGKHAEKYGKLYVDESIFNTIALQNNLSIITPKELQNILFRKKVKGRNGDWDISEIKPTHLYHPFKDTYKQQHFRTLL